MQNTKSHIVYPGLKVFKEGATSIDPHLIPGISEFSESVELKDVPNVLNGPPVLQRRPGGLSSWKICRAAKPQYREVRCGAS
jgi:hypothetical protein